MLQHVVEIWLFNLTIVNKHYKPYCFKGVYQDSTSGQCYGPFLDSVWTNLSTSPLSMLRLYTFMILLLLLVREIHVATFIYICVCGLQSVARNDASYPTKIKVSCYIYTSSYVLRGVVRG